MSKSLSDGRAGRHEPPDKELIELLTRQRSPSQLLSNFKQPNSPRSTRGQPLSLRIEGEVDHEALRADEDTRRRIRAKIVQVNLWLRIVERIRIANPHHVVEPRHRHDCELSAVGRKGKAGELFLVTAAGQWPLLPTLGVDEPRAGAEIPDHQVCTVGRTGEIE